MKTICIYHSRDLDGWMSAAIVKKWFGENNKAPHFTTIENVKAVNLEPFEEENNMTFLGWDYGDDIPDLSSYDKVIMTDVAFPVDEMIELRANHGCGFVWIDHHESAIIDSVKENYQGMAGTRNDKFAACELTWQYFFPNDKMPEIVRLLGRYDCFGHKGTDEEQKVLEFQYGARQAMSDYKSCYDFLIAEITHQSDIPAWHDIWQNGIIIYKYLCTEARQTFHKAFPIDFKGIDTGRGKTRSDFTYSFLCVNQERFNPINFGINYHDQGFAGFACFWYKDYKWHWSLYNDNGKVDVSVIAKRYNGGGHKGAAGMVVDDLSEIF